MVYLAGVLADEGDGSSYRPIADWTATEAGERKVVAELFAFFDRLADRGDAVVYHWTGYERTMLQAASDRHGIRLRTAPDVDTWFEEHGLRSLGLDQGSFRFPGWVLAQGHRPAVWVRVA